MEDVRKNALTGAGEVQHSKTLVSPRPQFPILKNYTEIIKSHQKLQDSVVKHSAYKRVKINLLIKDLLGWT